MTMFKLSVILYMMVFGYVSAHNYKSTIEASIPSNGHLCLGDCLRHDAVEMCMDTYSGHEMRCVNESRPTLRYRTIDGIECSSNCGNFEGYSYEWCVTEQAGSKSWGKCTRRVATGAVETLLVDEYLTCTSECARPRRFNRRGVWCNTAKGLKSCSSSKQVLLVKHFTKNFKLCSGPCENYGGYPYCYDEDGDWEQCYLNPDVSAILTKFNEYIHNTCPFGEYTEKGYQLCKQRRKRQALYYIWPTHHDVLSIANTFEGYCPSVTVNDPSNPIYSYSIRPMRGNRNLPLVIRARITSNHLRRPGQRQAITPAVRDHVSSLDQITGQPTNNDECGHLLASVLGGPTEYYNFIPQPTVHNRGYLSRWYLLEQDIKNFLNGHPNRHVEWVAVVSYDFTDPYRPYRPTGIGLSVRMYEGDTRTSSDDLENMFFTNSHSLTVCLLLEESDED